MILGRVAIGAGISLVATLAVAVALAYSQKPTALSGDGGLNSSGQRGAGRETFEPRNVVTDKGRDLTLGGVSHLDIVNDGRTLAEIKEFLDGF